ncbi:Uma2 family endonuclease [Streptomyces pinistramenti]|uniref:Uma2 family endonuclease n=1 Tax=Streptomyces pinistramenti TaxID=2884812 RepID=UPI001D0794CA|nr:Uma2 family endonuclease [Streptomyces pinistramenti]MCB5911532.1 Uma2 family endonuclease [Streptomyces pinistramenti]
MTTVSADHNDGIKPERALKHAIRHIRGDRVQIVEGIIEPVSPTWDHEAAAEIRDQIRARVRELDCVTGSGNLDLPGSSNRYVPDTAVVPAAAARGGGAPLPDQTLLVVEVTTESSGDTAGVVKRKRYAEYGAPLQLLVDRQERSVTPYSEPGPLGYTRADGPHHHGAVLHLPEPFGLDLDTGTL